MIKHMLLKENDAACGKRDEPLRSHIEFVTCKRCLQRYALAVLLGNIPLQPTVGLGGE